MSRVPLSPVSGSGCSSLGRLSCLGCVVREFCSAAVPPGLPPASACSRCAVLLAACPPPGCGCLLCLVGLISRDRCGDAGPAREGRRAGDEDLGCCSRARSWLPPSPAAGGGASDGACPSEADRALLLGPTVWCGGHAGALKSVSAEPHRVLWLAGLFPLPPPSCDASSWSSLPGEGSRCSLSMGGRLPAIPLSPWRGRLCSLRCFAWKREGKPCRRSARVRVPFSRVLAGSPSCRLCAGRVCAGSPSPFLRFSGPCGFKVRLCQAWGSALVWWWRAPVCWLRLPCRLCSRLPPCLSLPVA